MKVEEVAAAVVEVQAVGEEVLDALKVLDPGVAVPAALAETILQLVGKMVTSAVTAFANASGTPITVESLTALLPNQTPLTAPDAA